MAPPKPEARRSVFLNCPFDDSFAPLFDALVFATTCCGFTPRLVPSGHKYQKFISDLAAFDPATHDQTVEVLVPKVMNWLSSRPDAMTLLSPTQVLAALPTFQEGRQKLAKDWSGNVPWKYVLDLATDTIPKP